MKRSSWVTLATVLCTAVFGLAVSWAHPPLLADDYWWVWLPLHNPHFAWTELYTFARMPVLTTLAAALVKSQVLQAAPEAVMTFAFGVHACAFALLLQTLLERARMQISATSMTGLILITSLFAFQPSNYEIHLWPVMSVISLAELSMAFAFRARKLSLAVPLALLGLMTYDAIAFLLLGYGALLIALTWISARENFKTVLKRTLLLLAGAGTFWIVSKLMLGKFYGGVLAPPVEHSPLQILLNTRRVFRTLWLIHFYKANWILTILQWGAFACMGWEICRRKLLSAGQFGLLLLLPVVCALPLALNTYEAQRAYFGIQLVQSLVLAFLFLLLHQNFSGQNETSRNISKNTLFRAGLAVLVLVYGVQWVHILRIKRANHEALLANQSGIKRQIAECQSPCKLTVNLPDFKKDYVLPEMFQNFYLDAIRLEAAPEKIIQFEIARTAQLSL